MHLVEQNRLRDLAHELTLAAAPVVFTQAVTEEQKSRIYAQRFEAIEARRWGDHSQYPERREQDVYDREAIQIQGTLGNSLVASARIVFPQPDRPLPLEVSHAVSFAGQHRHVEIGRTIVMAKGLPVPRKYLFAALLGSVLGHMLDASYDQVAAVANGSMLRLYRRLGIEAKVLGPAAMTCGELRLPVEFDLVRSFQQAESST